MFLNAEPSFKVSEDVVVPYSSVSSSGSVLFSVFQKILDMSPARDFTNMLRQQQVKPSKKCFEEQKVEGTNSIAGVQLGDEYVYLVYLVFG